MQPLLAQTAALALSLRRPIWREAELVVLALLVIGIYFTRLTDLTIRGEESRWARVAQEMVETGDWIVPRQQIEPFPDRPPLNSWAMILASLVTGGLNLAAVRLPTVMATLLTTLLVYIYSRNFLSRLGAFAGAACYATMAQVLQLGRMGESDGLLTLCLAGALFAWHWGYAVRRSAALAWPLGYLMAALAGLCKGPQGPIYFVVITGLFLIWRRDWRFVFNGWHAAGLATFALVLGAWQVPFYWELDATSARAIWSEGGEMSGRFDYSRIGRVLRNWAAYPFEVLTCMMPWSLMLLVLPTKWMRERIGPARPMVAFLLTAIAVAFITCWLPAESRARYFMSMYPCVAPLIGLAIQACCEANEGSWWQRSWDRHLTGGTIIIGLCAVALLCGRAWGGGGLFGLADATSVVFVVSYVIVAIVAAVVAHRARFASGLLRHQAGVLALAGFMGLTYTGVVVSLQALASNNPADVVRSVRALIPEGERLVSFGKIHHLFAYYYGDPIELQPLGEGEEAVRMPGEYFCFAIDPTYEPPSIPFDWEPIAEISCERSRSANPRTKVVVGRCLPAAACAATEDDSMVRPASYAEGDGEEEMRAAAAPLLTR
jgi:4-amino-4-deoxy-L-arabinose transferase-like glycosyltransferase